MSMTYLGQADLERSIAPPPTIQYSYIVTFRLLFILFNENLKKSYLIQNVNVSPIKYQYYIIQIESNISNFSMIKGVKLPPSLSMLSFNSEPHGTHKMLVETSSRLYSSWLGYEVGQLLDLYSHAEIQDGGRRCMFLMKNSFNLNKPITITQIACKNAA